MVFEGPESRSGRPFEITVPEKLVPPLEYYLQAVRPNFTAADRHDGMWASTKGRPLTRNAIARIITERTREAFGATGEPTPLPTLCDNDHCNPPARPDWCCEGPSWPCLVGHNQRILQSGSLDRSQQALCGSSYRTFSLITPQIKSTVDALAIAKARSVIAMEPLTLAAPSGLAQNLPSRKSTNIGPFFHWLHNGAN